jgi:hypothetical protein
MAASKSIREALTHSTTSCLQQSSLPLRSITSTLTSRASPPPLHDPHAWVFVVVQMVDRLERASKRWKYFCDKRHCQCLKTWKTSPGRSKPGAGNPVSPARGVAEEVPDRATLKTTSGSDGRRPPLFRVHCTLCPSPILPRHQD